MAPRRAVRVVPVSTRHAWRLALVSFALLAAMAPPHALAAPAVPGVMHGSGTAATFQLLGAGSALEGGASDWTIVCGGCLLRVAFTQTEFSVTFESGRASSFSPGVYEVREFYGVFSITDEGPGQFFVQLHGAGHVARL